MLALLAAFALVAAACGSDDGGDGDGDAAPEDAGDEVDLTQTSDLTFHMVTHSDDGPFWSVVKRGAEDAAAALGVEMVWSPSDNDPEKQA